MVQEILKRLAQAAVGLDQALAHVVLQPALEPIQDRATVSLMVGQTRSRRQPLLAGSRLMLEYPVEIVNHPLTVRGKDLFNLGELSPAVRQAVAANDRPFILKRVDRERIRHHDRRATLGVPQAQHFLQIFPPWARPANYKQI